MKILIINAGSSSLKYQLIDMSNEQIIAKGQAERIGIAGSVLKHSGKGPTFVQEQDMKDHTEAIKLALAALVDKDHGVLASMDEITAVGHRVLHGGDRFSDSVLINDDVMEAIRDNIDLGPLHNPANLMGIEACQKVMPDTPMVAVFDTAFHQTMPKTSFLYALPYEAYTKHKVRRYGFHGSSHRYVSARAAEFLGKPKEELKIITCHLGNGSSMAAVKYGKCFDTSMGLTPLEGVPMGTRSGDIDPAIIKYLMGKEGMTIDEMDNYLNKKSGMLGVSGLSSDFRDLCSASDEGNERAALALDIFCYRVKKYVGAYAAAMGGVDAIVFTAGVGENTACVREKVVDGLEYMGVKLDKGLNCNADRGKDFCISTPDSKVSVLIIPTNEELVIAQDTAELCKK